MWSRTTHCLVTLLYVRFEMGSSSQRLSVETTNSPTHTHHTPTHTSHACIYLNSKALVHKDFMCDSRADEKKYNVWTLLNETTTRRYEFFFVCCYELLDVRVCACVQFLYTKISFVNSKLWTKLYMYEKFITIVYYYQVLKSFWARNKRITSKFKLTQPDTNSLNQTLQTHIKTNIIWYDEKFNLNTHKT